MIVECQIRGGVVQDIGTAPYEEIPYNEAGQLVTGPLADYLLPGAAELPAIKIGRLRTPAAASLYGMKGMGEGGVVAPPSARAHKYNENRDRTDRNTRSVVENIQLDQLVKRKATALPNNEFGFADQRNAPGLQGARTTG
jgi:hypothetical protein